MLILRYFVLMWGILLSGGFVACRPSTNDVAEFSLKLTAAEFNEGQRTVRLYCAPCHGIAGNHQDAMLAPSLWAVRQHYINKHPTPDAFVAAMLAFLDEPTDDAGLMPQAIEKYGLMAMLPLSESERNAAVRLIAAGHVERPSWARFYDQAHATCYEQVKGER
jgi:hypothetical protein